MNSIQEALHELMRRTRDTQNAKQADKKVSRKKSLNEGVKNNKKEPLLPELWDQVYCTLVDAGDNVIYEICGGKGKYNPDEVAIVNAEGKYDDHILKIIYDKQNNKSESVFFSEAERVTEKFSLKTRRTETTNFVYFNIYIPQDGSVYFDFIPEKFRERIALENGESLNNLPVSPLYAGEKLTVYTQKEVEQESLLEDLNVELPVNILSENDVLEFIDAVPKATKDRGPASLTFTIGFATEIEPASQFKDGGRGHTNKETGEIYPTVTIIKCSEISGLYLESYASSKKTVAHNKQMTRYEENPEYVMEPKREVASWLEFVPEHRGLFRSKRSGELVLVPLAAKNSRTRTKYFISINGEDLRVATKNEIAQYLTPAKQAEFMSGREINLKLGPDGKEIISPAQPLTFYLKKIYRIGDKGQSIF